MIQIKTIKNKYGNFTVYGTDKWFARATLPLAKAEHEKPFVKYIETNGKLYKTFVDIGANYGYFSIIASHYMTLVYAVEAHPIRYGFLKWNTMDIPTIQADNKYIGKSKKIVTAKEPTGMVASNKDDYIQIRDISTRTLDSIPFPLDYKHLVKIDVEGNELDVLESGIEVLKQPNIDWFVEIHKFRGIEEQEVFKYFEGYKKELMFKRKMTSHYLFRRDG